MGRSIFYFPTAAPHLQRIPKPITHLKERGMVLDRDHPLSRGIIHGFLATEEAGLPREITTGKTGAKGGSSASSATWERHRRGWGLYTPTGLQCQWQIPKTKPIAHTFTVLAIVTPTYSDSVTYPLAFGSFTTASARVFECLWGYAGNGPRLIIEVEGTRRDCFVSPAALTVGVPSVFTMRRRASDGASFLNVNNGATYSNPTLYAGNITNGNTYPWAVGTMGGSSWSRGGIVHMVLMWDHLLSDNAVRNLHANPYQLLRAPKRIKYFFAPSPMFKVAAIRA